MKTNLYDNNDQIMNTSVSSGKYIIISKDKNVTNFLIIDLSTFIDLSGVEYPIISKYKEQLDVLHQTTATYPISLINRVLEMPIYYKVIYLPEDCSKLNLDVAISDTRWGCLSVEKYQLMLNNVDERKIMFEWTGVSKIKPSKDSDGWGSSKDSGGREL